LGTRAGRTRIAAAVRPRSADVRETNRRVGDAVLFELQPAMRWQHRHDDALDVGPVQRRPIQAHDGAVDANRGRACGHEQQIAAAPLYHFLEERLEAQNASRGRGGGRGLIQLGDQRVDVSVNIVVHWMLARIAVRLA
jgi:hypothetical protein